MSVTLLQSVNFGRQRANVTGSLGVGYTLLDTAGAIVQARTTTGVVQLQSGSGLYSANVVWPDNFNGQIMWDCPQITSSFGTVLAPAYAAEQYNVQANDPKVADTWNMVTGLTGSIQGLYDVAFGRWKIDKVAKTMTFYRPDNTTVVAVFKLYDDAGNPVYDGVYDRWLNGPVTP